VPTGTLPEIMTEARGERDVNLGLDLRDGIRELVHPCPRHAREGSIPRHCGIRADRSKGHEGHRSLVG